MRIDHLIRLWLSPRIIVKGYIDPDQAAAIERMPPGRVAMVHQDCEIQTITPGPLHIHINGRKPRRTASMGPTIKAMPYRGRR